jgi:hypothetical protein
MNRDTDLIFEAYKKRLISESPISFEQAIDATIQHHRGSSIGVTFEGSLDEYFHKHGAEYSYNDFYNYIKDKSRADKNFSEHQSDTDEESSPEYQAALAKHREELKANGWEPMEHGGSIKNKGGDTLYYFWSGESYYQGAVLNSAVQTAEDYGFKKVVIIPQG